MSRLRAIFVEGDVKTLRKALEDVLFLCSISTTTRATIVAGIAANRKPILRNTKATEASEVPALFQAMVQKASEGRNAHYQQALVVWYMLYDAELFGRWMLANEPPKLQELFMKALKEMTAFFIAGHQMNGSLFKPGDNLANRRTGHFITRVREMFASL